MGSLGIWIAIFGGLNTVLSAVAVVWRRFEKPFAILSMFLGLTAIGGGAYLQWKQSNLWTLTIPERENLRREACSQMVRYYLPIFWTQNDPHSQSYAEDLFAVFGQCGWPVVLDRRSWVGPNVVGATVDSIANTKEKTVEWRHIKQIFDRARVPIGEGTEDQAHLMPGGVGIKVGRRPDN